MEQEYRIHVPTMLETDVEALRRYLDEDLGHGDISSRVIPEGTTAEAELLVKEDAVIAGMKVLVSEVHGMAQRGGVVESTVKIGDVHSPILRNGDADILLGFELSETLRALRKASKKTTVVTSTDTIIPITVSLGKGEYPDAAKALEEIRSVSTKTITFPLVELAKQAGNVITANSVMIGALAGSGLLPYEEHFLREAMEQSVPPRALEVNRKAYELGRAAVEKGV